MAKNSSLTPLVISATSPERLPGGCVLSETVLGLNHKGELLMHPRGQQR